MEIEPVTWLERTGLKLRVDLPRVGGMSNRADARPRASRRPLTSRQEQRGLGEGLRTRSAGDGNEDPQGQVTDVSIVCLALQTMLTQV